MTRLRVAVVGVSLAALLAMVVLHLAIGVAVIQDLRTHPEFRPDLFAWYCVPGLMLNFAVGGLIVSRWRTAPLALIAGLGFGVAAADAVVTAVLAVATMRFGS